MKTISRAKALLLHIDQSGVIDKAPKKPDIRRANRKLKEVFDITGVDIQIKEEHGLKRR